jgi:uncharacterized protein YndB with AHSA1/START domain
MTKEQTMSDAETLTERSITIERTFDAPRELVWAAWTTPAQIEQWFGPRPVTIKPGSVVIDPRRGGEFCLVMVMPDGTEFPNIGTFSEFDEPSRLAFGGRVENHPGLNAASTAVTFTDLGDGRTAVVLTNTMMCSDEMPEMARRGWTQCLEQIAELLAAA